MQTPTGRQRPTHPIPRPRPHGPADLGILADDLDYLAGMNDHSHAPELKTGMGGGAQVSGLDLPSDDGYAVGEYDGYGGYGGPGYGMAGHADAGYAETEAGYAEPGTDADVAAGFDADSDAGLEWADDHSDAAPAGPIFVDASGRRHKLARRASMAAIAVVAGYAGLLAVSFAGGPIPPKTLLPVPGMPSEKNPAPASNSVAENGAPTSGKPSAAERPAAGQPTGSASEHRPETRTSSTAGKPVAGTPTAPQPTSTSAAASPPVPTSPPAGNPASSSATGHGNPTPPGHQHKSSPGPTG